MNEIDTGVTVEKTVTMGEAHYRNLMDEIVRLRNQCDALIGAVETASAERDRLRDALERLERRAGQNEDGFYATMSSKYVRDIARAALKGDTQ